MVERKIHINWRFESYIGPISSLRNSLTCLYFLPQPPQYIDGLNNTASLLLCLRYAVSSPGYFLLSWNHDVDFAHGRKTTFTTNSAPTVSRRR